MSLRLFAALDIPDQIADRLTPLQRGVDGAKWRPREALHLTLRFFSDVREDVARDLDGELDAIAQTTAPFEVSLRGAGAFGGETPHALWIGVSPNPTLRKLAADCERAARRAGLAPETRKYTPHVTMAYLKGSPLDRVLAFQTRLGLFQSDPWTTDRFTLYSSWSHRDEARTYLTEAEYPLMGA